MRECVNSWLRKLGCVTLLLALLFAATWIRSVVVDDYAAFPFEVDTGHRLLAGEATEDQPLVGAAGDTSSCADELESLKPSDELVRLRKIWAGWKDQATSIDVEGFEFYGTLREDSAHISPADLQKLVEVELPQIMSENPRLDLTLLTAATLKMFPELDKDNLDASFGRWAKFSLIRAADNVRWTIGFHNDQRTWIRRGSLEQQYSIASRQANVYTKIGSQRIPEIEMFVFGPKLAKDSMPWQFLDLQPTNRQLILRGEKGNAVQVDYDPASGLVRYHGIRLADKHYRERFQSAAKFTSNGIPVPRIVADIDYHSARPPTRRVTIYITTAVEIGKEIDRSRFNLSVPAGARVRLHEGPQGLGPPAVNPHTLVTEIGVEDAAEFIYPEESRKTQEK